jgi:general secretion pathway protein G
MRYSLRTLLIVLFVAPPVLAAAAMVATSKRPSSYVQATRAQVSLLETAVSAYALNVESLPPNLEALLAPPADLTNPERWEGPYLNRAQLPTDPWGSPFEYEVVDELSEQFFIWSRGPYRLSGTDDDIYSHDSWPPDLQMWRLRRRG